MCIKLLHTIPSYYIFKITFTILQEKCDAKSTCIIWQWQPTRRICWIMDVVPYPDRNSDFGINNCDNGKPTGNIIIQDLWNGSSMKNTDLNRD